MEFSLNRLLIDKEYTSMSHNSWEQATGDIKEVMYFIKKGYAIAPATFNGSKANENFKSSQMIFLDFDNGQAFGKVLDREYTKNHLAAFYFTPSATEDNLKFRLIFKLDNPIDNTDDYKLAILGLLSLYPEADQACKDVSRCFFGNSKLSNKDYLKGLGVNTSQEQENSKNISPFELIKLGKGATVPQVERFAKAQYEYEQDLNLDLQNAREALSFIPTQGDYEDWRNIAWGCINHFGEGQGKLLINEWSPDLKKNGRHLDDLANKSKKAHTLGTVFYIAMKYGYKPPLVMSSLVAGEVKKNLGGLLVGIVENLDDNAFRGFISKVPVGLFERADKGEQEAFLQIQGAKSRKEAEIRLSNLNFTLKRQAVSFSPDMLVGIIQAILEGLTIMGREDIILNGGLSESLDVLSVKLSKVEKKYKVREVLEDAREVSKAEDHISDLLEFFSQEDDSLKTGYSELDEILQGLPLGGVTVLGGSTGSGKSTLALNMITRIGYTSRNPIAFYSYEMKSREHALRACSYLCGESSKQIKEKFKAGVNINKYKKGLEALTHISFVHCPYFTVLDIAEHLRNFKRDNPDCKMAVVDHLHLVKPSPEFASRSLVESLGETTSTLKRVASELDINILLLAQLSRPEKGVAYRNPTLSDLRASGSIEQDANQVILIARNTQHSEDDEDDEEQGGSYTRYGKKAKTTSKKKVPHPSNPAIIVAKNREGATGVVAFTFIGETYCFKEESEDKDQVLESLRDRYLRL